MLYVIIIFELNGLSFYVIVFGSKTGHGIHMLPNTQSHRTMPVNIYVSTPASQCVRIHVSTNVSFENLFWVQILVSSISIVASADHSSQCSQVGKDVAGNRPKKWQSTCQYRH